MNATNDAKIRRRGILICRAEDAVPLTDTDCMNNPAMSPSSASAISELVEAGLSDGGTTDVLLRQSLDEGGFMLVRLWFKPHYPLMRHSHDVDCLYYVLSGDAKMGSQTLRTGDSFFVPAGAPYGYSAGPRGVEILEIRHGVTQFNMTIADQPDSRWQAMVEVVSANSGRWARMNQSPTLATRGG